MRKSSILLVFMLLVMMIAMSATIVAAKEVIRVAIEPFYPPFEQMDPDETYDLTSTSSKQLLRRWVQKSRFTTSVGRA